MDVIRRVERERQPQTAIQDLRGFNAADEIEVVDVVFMRVGCRSVLRRCGRELFGKARSIAPHRWPAGAPPEDEERVIQHFCGCTRGK